MGAHLVSKYKLQDNDTKVVMASSKSTVYVDVDDEVTAIIEKVAVSSSKIVALVLPKRASALKSLVNMKLLKRSAEQSKKQLVLITSESSLLPLAGAAGIYVARTLTSKPEIPRAASDDEVESIREDSSSDTGDGDVVVDESKPIGELAGLTGAANLADDNDGPIELDNSTPSAPTRDIKPIKSKKDKKLHIPNFSRFRNSMLIAVIALIGIGVLGYLALFVWPHATIDLYTQQSQIPLNFTMTLSSNANEAQPADGILPALSESQTHSYSQTVTASGKKDIGQRASGSVSMTQCVPFGEYPDSVPSGTGVSTNNLTYITQNKATFGPITPINGCDSNSGTIYTSGSIDIVAQKPGDNYNVDSSSFAVSGFSGVTATGSASGGSSNVVQVVQDSDIKSAEQKIQSQDDSAVEQSIISALKQNNLVPLLPTYTADKSDLNISAKSGDQADNVTVTENINYSMFGYKQADMTRLIREQVGQKINDSQAIVDDGLASASFKMLGSPQNGSVDVQVSTTVTVGPKIDQDRIKTDALGKKIADVRSQVNQITGVQKVEVNLSPFWVVHVPSDSSKVTIQIHKSDGS